MFPPFASWMLVLELFTGQVVLLPSGTEMECRQALQDIGSGDDFVVRMDSGLILPIKRGIECIDQEEAARRQGKT